MPEFHIPVEANDARWNSLDEFQKGFVEAMFFTSTGSADDEDLECACFEELSELALESIVLDCKAFQEMAKEELELVYDMKRKDYAYDENAEGRDFWYTRNGHGVGFWCRDLGELGDKLSEYSKKFREMDLYLGDDGLVYFS